MAIDKTRETALKILYDVNEKKAYSNIVVNDYFDNSELAGLDRAFITELVFGTLNWRLTIDWIIKKFSTVKMKKISPWILNILRMGVYQLIYLDKVPASAAVNESVNLAARYGHKGSVKFVNGLLRGISRNKSKINFGVIQDQSERLSIQYSHPIELVNKFLDIFGYKFTKDLLCANNSKADFSVRTNTLKTTRDDLVSTMTDHGYIVHRGKYVNDAILIDNPGGIMDTELHKGGCFQVQDESSMMAVSVLDPKPGDVVIDVCSAPGGKTAYMAQYMKNEGLIYACDIYEHRLDLVNKSAERLGISIIDTVKHDSVKIMEKYRDIADKVLVDVPCSGLGILRRKPDIKWSFDLSKHSELTDLQYQILDSSSHYVKAGGILVYSTCTILPEENQQIVQRFISEHPEFEFDNIAPFLHQDLRKYISESYIQLFPSRDKVDGFFISRMKRKA